MKRIRGLLTVAVLAAVSFLVSGFLTRKIDEFPTLAPTAAPTAAEYDSATVAVGGQLSAAVRGFLPAMDLPMPYLVVLRAEDVQNCEDLGRQLRDVRALGGSLLIAADSGAAVEVAAFARRERLGGEMIVVSPEDIIEGLPALPTPAVLRVREDGSGTGVAHPLRFPNARVRSFAEELSILDS